MAPGDTLAPMASWLGEQGAHLKMYALADAAQDAALPAAIAQDGPAQSLFSPDNHSPIAKVSPHLVLLPPLDADARPWKWIERHAPMEPSVTLIAGTADFGVLLAHLVSFLDVRLDDGEEMFLAYWDPAILGSLVGQADDATLHVRGPILTEEQRAALLAPIAAWWYWDRETILHRILAPTQTSSARVDVQPLRFSAAQVALIVEASVPDHVLNYLRENTPEMLIGHAPPDQYRRVREQIGQARTYGIKGTGDLVNYCAVAFSLGFNFDRRTDVAPVLAQVKAGTVKFDAVLDVLEAAEKLQ